MSQDDEGSRSAGPRETGRPSLGAVVALEYPYQDVLRRDILAMVPADGTVIGSIGCGSGTEGILVEQGREVHGVDIAAEAVEAARGT